MEYVITPIWVLLEIASIVVFFSGVLQFHNNRAKKWLPIIANWAFVSLCAFIIPSGILKQIFTISSTFCMALVSFRGSWLKKLIFTILGVLFLGIIDTGVIYGVCALLKISYADFTWRMLQYVITVTIAKLIALLLAYLFAHYRKRGCSDAIEGKWLLLTVLFPAACLSSIVMFFVLFQDSADIPVGVFIYACILAVANIAILYMIRIMEKQSQKEQQLALMRQQRELQTESIIALEKSYRAQRTASHEFGHHLQTIADLIAQGNAKTAEQYIHEQMDSQAASVFVVNTHHPILDAIFNQKYQVACEQHTEMRFHINDLSATNIPTEKLVVLFSNLLVNALEACQKVQGGGSIDCTVLLEEKLFVSIKNTSEPVSFEGKYPKTTKEPLEEHGYGLKSVEHILDSLNAEYVFNYEDHFFCFAAEIPDTHS